MAPYVPVRTSSRLMTRQPVLYVKYTGANVDNGMVMTPPPGAWGVLLRAETQNIRWRDDGPMPTASVGMLMLPADVPYWYAGNLTTFAFISATAGAVLHAVFYQ